MKKVFGVRRESWDPIVMVCESHDDAVEFACAMKGVDPKNSAIPRDSIVTMLFVEADPQTHFSAKIEPGGVMVMSDDALSELGTL